MKEYGYQKNEWCVVYANECGERQILQFDLFEQAMEFTVNVKKQGTCIIGIMTSSFYEHCVK